MSETTYHPGDIVRIGNGTVLYTVNEHQRAGLVHSGVTSVRSRNTGHDRDVRTERLALIEHATRPVLDYLTPDQVGPELHEVIALQIALNSLASTGAREDYPPVVAQPDPSTTNIALHMAAFEYVGSAPTWYLPPVADERLYLLPWAV